MKQDKNSDGAGLVHRMHYTIGISRKLSKELKLPPIFIYVLLHTLCLGVNFVTSAVVNWRLLSLWGSSLFRVI